MSLAAPSKILELQIKLYRKAKKEPGYRFYMLYDKCRKHMDDLETAGSRYCGTSFGEACLRTERHPALRWPELARRGRAERGNLGLRCQRRSHKRKNHEGESTEAETSARCSFQNRTR
jgi:hypothetical protein